MKKKPEKNPERKKDDPEQSRRFVETAKELESDESGKKFEDAMKTIKNKN